MLAAGHFSISQPFFNSQNIRLHVHWYYVDIYILPRLIEEEEGAKRGQYGSKFFK